MSSELNTKTDVEKWIREDGLLFLKTIGLKNRQKLVDFGCNIGHYTIPAAKVLKSGGTVYAMDKDEDALSKLTQTAKLENLKNIVAIKTSAEPIISLKNSSANFVLLYDILHYFTLQERKALYREVHRVLKINGILSVYPKHNETDEPHHNLSNLTVEDIIKEIEGVKLRLKEKISKELMHSGKYNRGYVLNFLKV